MDFDFEHYDPKLVANFVRLFKDAELLRDNQRYASAYALALIGLEEVAKIIIMHWESAFPNIKLERRRNQHLTKQAALSCLLVAERLSPHYDSIMEKEASEEIGRLEISIADHAFMMEAHNEELQRSKHLALYHDLLGGDDIGAELTFDAEMVNDLFRYARRAVMLTADPKAMLLARGLFHAMKSEPLSERDN